MIEKLITESVELTFGNFCNEDLIARQWWQIEALISFSQFVSLCNFLIWIHLDLVFCQIQRKATI